MEESAEFLRADVAEDARTVAEKAIDDAKRNDGIEIHGLDIEGNEWGYKLTLSEAFTMIKLKEEGQKHPAITLIQKKIAGERGIEFVITFEDGKGSLKRVIYNKLGQVHRVEDIGPSKLKGGVYQSKEIPQNIDPQKTAKGMFENLSNKKYELPKLVSKPVEAKTAPIEAATPRKAA